MPQMGKLRHQQALRLQAVPGSCATLLYPSHPFFGGFRSHQDCDNAGVCPSCQPAGSKSEDTAAVWALRGREGAGSRPGTSLKPALAQKAGLSGSCFAPSQPSQVLAPQQLHQTPLGLGKAAPAPTLQPGKLRQGWG